MTIWLLAIFIYGLTAYTGKFQGGVRMAISFAGIFLGALLAWPLAPKIKGLIAMIGFQNPFWNFILPPLVIWLVFMIVFTALAYSIYFKMDLYYKYKADDDERVAFYKLNSGLGLALSSMTATVYLVVAGMVIYLTGYLTTQIKSDKENPMALRLINQARADLKSSGLEKICDAINPVPASYFDVADCLGLLLKNADLRNRLADYPALLSLAERPEFKDLGADAEFQGVLTNGGTILEIILQPKIQALIQNKELLGRIQDLDYHDLLGFLRTGKSEKYASEPLLGQWQIDLPGTVNSLKKKAKWGPAEFGYARRALGRLLPDTTLMAGADNTVFLKSSLADFKVLPRIATFKLPDVAAARVPPTPSLPAGATNGVVAQGTWRKEGDNYTLSLGELGESAATIKADRLEVMLLNEPVVFLKVD
jgi:hypothetical protein